MVAKSDGRYLGKVMVAGPNPAECSIFQKKLKEKSSFIKVFFPKKSAVEITPHAEELSFLPGFQYRTGCLFRSSGDV
jgi:hypothetical protein